MINIAIVEDEDECAAQIGEYVHRFASENSLECSVQRFTNGMDFVSDYRPFFDLVLMDIEMPYMNGMDAAKKLRKLDGDVAIIFITNMAQYAINGYEVQAVDFIVKPVEYFSFSAKMKKALWFIRRDGEKKIFVTTENATRRILVKDLVYVEVSGHFITYHLSNKENITVRGMLSKVENSLIGCGFFRSCKSYLVNLRFVKEIRPNSIIVGEQELILSRSCKKDFLKALAEFIGGNVE